MIDITVHETNHYTEERIDAPDKKASSFTKTFPLNKSQKLAIDGLRGFLALWVLWLHLETQLEKEVVAFFPHLHMFLHHGFVAIEIFFSLSGFLIFRSYEHLLTLKKKHSIFRFYMRRVFRIWPVWCFVLCLNSFNTADASAKNILWNFFLLFGFSPYILSDLIVITSWTLFAEEIFYLSFPFIYKIIKLGGFVPLLALSLLGLSLWWHISPIMVPIGYKWSTPLDTFGSFFIGIAFALISPHLNKYSKFIKNTAITDIVILIFLITLISVDGVIHTQALSIILLFCVLQENGIFHWIFKKLFSIWGPRCYCIYLIHPFVLERFNYLLWRGFFLSLQGYSRLNLILKFLVPTVVTLVLAEILHRAIEKPMQNLGHRLSEA